jgi:hypothetical protein
MKFSDYGRAFATGRIGVTDVANAYAGKKVVAASKATYSTVKAEIRRRSPPPPPKSPEERAEAERRVAIRQAKRLFRVIKQEMRTTAP